MPNAIFANVLLLTVSKASFTNKTRLFNKIRSVDFNDVIKDSNLIKHRPGIQKFTQHLKISCKQVMAFGSNRAIQRDQILNNMIQCIRTTKSIFHSNPAFVHHPLVSFVSGR